LNKNILPIYNLLPSYFKNGILALNYSCMTEDFEKSLIGVVKLVQTHIIITNIAKEEGL